MAQAKVTEERLDEMLDHLHYEVGQLILLLRFSNPWVWVLADELWVLAQRSIFEAGLLHLRVLVEFLGSSMTDDGTVVARHYLGAGWDWKIGEALGNKVAHVHGRLAHLGLIRVDDTEFTWGDWLEDNVPVVLRGVHDFLQQLQETDPKRFERFTSSTHEGWSFDLEGPRNDLAQYE